MLDKLFRRLFVPAALLAMFCSPSVAQTLFREGGTVACDDRYPHTCDVRGFGKELPRKGAVKKHRRAAAAGKTLNGVIAPLAEKIEQIVRACGSTILSAIRHTQVAGSGRLSCHSAGNAVDVAGNPACIYRMLRGWPGGYSTDYARVRCAGKPCPHVHVSLGCREDGKRFIHRSQL